MAVINNSQQSLASGAQGAWFTSAGTLFYLDIDNRGRVLLETRRTSGDAAPKRLAAGIQEGAAMVMQGPGCFQVQAVAGRDYRVVCIDGPAIVAADQ